MRLLVALLLCALAVAASTDGSASASWQLRAEVVVRDDAVRLGDVVAAGLPPELADLTLRPAPRPGAVARIARREILRECVRHGVHPLPELRGASQVRVVRSNGARHSLEDADWLSALGRIELPAGALAQRFVPQQDWPSASRIVDVAPPDRSAGPLTLRVRTRDAEGREAKSFVRVRRELLVPVVVAAKEIDAQTAIGSAETRVDTLWVSDPRVFDRRLAPAACDGRFSSIRRLPASTPILRSDVRATPVVRRSQRVKWTVRRGAIHLEVDAVARGQGAVGDWILVTSPFSSRPQRVVVVGPGRVASEIPTTEPLSSDSPQGGAR